MHVHTHKYYMHKMSNGITNIPACLFQKVPPRLKLSCGWKKEKKEKKN